MTAAVFEERSEPGRLASALLAAAMHALLFLVLLFGVRWQNRPADTVNVELWEPAPAPVVEAPRPAPVAEPPPQPKPEPVIAKPEIVEQKAPPPKPVPKVEPKPKPEPPKAVAKAPKEPAKPRDDAAQRQIREQLLREQAALAIDREQRQLAEASRSSALATWMDKVRIHIRSRIRIEIAQAVAGNPEAVYVVTLLPTYEVIRVTKVKSSGNNAYDEEIERAIQKSSPLPKPDKPELFNRELRLTFRPKD